MTSPLITIGIAGGTGAGKTTLATSLFEQLGGEEHVAYLVHDCYYRDSSHLPLEERAAINFDHPESLETDLMIQHIRKLKEGQAAEVPQYDFSTHSRKVESKVMQPRKIILVEGILIFCYPELVKELDLKVYVDADSDIRLMRRIARDTKERGRTVEDILQQYHATVRPMHDEYVEPSKLKADLIVHSTGHSMETAIKMLKNHIQVEVGIL